jgi:hypothetical protein
MSTLVNFSFKEDLPNLWDQLNAVGGLHAGWATVRELVEELFPEDHKVFGIMFSAVLGMTVEQLQLGVAERTTMRLLDVLNYLVEEQKGAPCMISSRICG